MKSINAEEDITDFKADIQPMMMNVTMMNRRIKDNTTNVKSILEQIELLKGGSGASIPVPIPAAPVKIEIPEGNIDANQMAQIFAAKDVVANLERRIAQCETTDQQHNNIVNDHEQRIATLEESMNQFSGDINNKMLNLEQLINQMGSVPTGSGDVDLGPFQIAITKMQT